MLVELANLNHCAAPFKFKGAPTPTCAGTTLCYASTEDCIIYFGMHNH